jgi:hypothetical protein
MNTKALIASFGVAAAAAAPALLFVGAGTANADDCYGSMAYSYYCSPASQSGGYSDPGISYTPIQPAFGYGALPQCSGGGLAGIFGALSGDGC